MNLNLTFVNNMTNSNKNKSNNNVDYNTDNVEQYYFSLLNIILDRRYTE